MNHVTAPAAGTGDWPAKSSARELLWVLLALGALVYPLFLRSAYGSGQLITGSSGKANSIGAVLAYVLSLGTAYSVPVSAALLARHLSRAVPLTAVARRAVRVCHLAFAAPPLYTALGVVTFILGFGALDLSVWIALWMIVIAVAVAKRSAAPEPQIAKAAGGLRRFHGIAALAILLSFLLAHLGNHVLALWSTELHGRVMKVLETIYRHGLVEPALVLLIASLLGSGLVLMWKHTAAPQDGFGTLQTLTGFYLAAFVASHLVAVFVMARWLENIPTDWNFASGAPVGLLKDPWNVRLIPHYSVAVWAVIAHVGLGARGVMRAHGAADRIADRFAWATIGVGAIVSALISAALLGVHLRPS
jgi:hypothetical protein